MKSVASYKSSSGALCELIDCGNELIVKYNNKKIHTANIAQLELLAEFNMEVLYLDLICEEYEKKMHRENELDRIAKELGW